MNADSEALYRSVVLTPLLRQFTTGDGGRSPGNSHDKSKQVLPLLKLPQTPRRVDLIFSWGGGIGVALGDPVRKMKWEHVLGYLELILLGLWSASKLHCDDKVTVTPDPATCCLSNPPGYCYCSMLEVGKLKFRGSVIQLSSQGHTAGKGWSQDLNPELSGSPGSTVFLLQGLSHQE